MVSNVNPFFVNADNVCDYIPVVSTFSNLADLFQKCVVLSFMSTESIVNSHYYTHLEKKDILRCLVLLIPMIGNIIVGIYDFAHSKYNGYIDVDSTLAAVRQRGTARRRGLALEDASEELRNDKDSTLAAVQQRGWALAVASEELKNDKEVVLAAVRQNGMVLKYAKETFRDDKEVVLAAVRRNGMALQYANEQLKGHGQVVLAAVRQNGLALLYISSQLREELNHQAGLPSLSEILSESRRIVLESTRHINSILNNP